MKDFKIAIIGCGTIGGGTARVLLEMNEEFNKKAGVKLVLSKIVDMFPKKASEKYNIPLSLFCGNGNDLTKEEATKFSIELINANDIDLIVEAIGGSSEYVLNLVLNALKAKKHIVTPNKALLSKYGNLIFETAEKNNRAVGIETSVCTSIPIIKVIKECFVSDDIQSISGIMNGTSNYILSKMQNENLTFDEALKLAQENGYAEADPSLDINGGDAGHKLTILMKLAFGIDVPFEKLTIQGIQNITKEDLISANEMDCTIKLIGFARKENDTVHATVRPMMVKYSNLLSQITGTTNAVRVFNKYTDENFFIGKGAGSLEGGSAMSSDIIFIARYADKIQKNYYPCALKLGSLDNIPFAYNIVFSTDDIPGITGFVTTAIGNNNINIDTVGHNRHDKKAAIFSISTMPCTLSQIDKAIEEIKKKRPEILRSEPKILPILF